MARPIKQSLDYFPQDVDFLRDIKISKLKRSQGGKAIAVWTSLLCRIYGSCGYYMKWDEELPFFVAEELPGFDEVYIREVIKSCLNFGLFHKPLFESRRVLTSAAIQRRFIQARAACRYRYADIIDDNLRLVPRAHNSSVFSEKTAVISEKTPIISEKTPVLSEISTQMERKVKESKIKTPSSVDDVVVASATPPPSPPQDDEGFFFDEFVERISHDKGWLTSVAERLKVGSYAKVLSLFSIFRDEHQLLAKKHPDIIDAKKHFLSWLKIRLANDAALQKQGARHRVNAETADYDGSF